MKALVLLSATMSRNAKCAKSPAMADAYEPLNGSEMMELSRMFARAAVNNQLNDPVLRKHLLPCRVTRGQLAFRARPPWSFAEPDLCLNASKRGRDLDWDVIEELVEEGIPRAVAEVGHIDHGEGKKLPSDVASFEQWGKTKVTMKKYANHGYTFKSVVKASYTDSEVTQYLSWILKTYAGKSISSQGPDLAAYLEYMIGTRKCLPSPRDTRGRCDRSKNRGKAATAPNAE